MPPVFRDTPPKEIVNQVLKTIGLTGFHDTTWFCKTQIQLQDMEELLPLLEPYYLPCKAQAYLHANPFTPNTAITILRQILKPWDASLKTVEKSRGGVKSTWYQIQLDSKDSVNSLTDNGITVEFI